MHIAPATQVVKAHLPEGRWWSPGLANVGTMSIAEEDEKRSPLHVLVTDRPAGLVLKVKGAARGRDVDAHRAGPIGEAEGLAK